MNKSILEFEAKVVSIGDQDGVSIASFADDEMSPEMYIILQRCAVETQQDRDLGLNTYFFEMCCPGDSGYGGISKAALYKDVLELDMQPGNEALPKLEKIVVRLNVSGAERVLLEKQLKAIFDNSACTFVVM